MPPSPEAYPGANGAASDPPTAGAPVAIVEPPAVNQQGDGEQRHGADAGHGNHDHEGHSHGDGVAGHERLAGTVRVDLPVVLPHARAGRDQCIGRLRELLLAQRGIREAHLETAHGRETLCVHYEPDELTLTQVMRAVSRSGAAVTRRYGHEALWVAGMSSADNAQDLEWVLRRLPGVVEASINYAAERALVEWDTRQTSRKRILAEIERMGCRVVDEGDDHEHGHEGHDHSHAGHDHGPGEHAPQEGGHAHSHGGGLRWAIVSGVLLAWAYGIQKLYVEGMLGESFGISRDPHSLFVLALYAGAYVAGGLDLARHGLKAALRGSFDIEFLMVVAAVGAAVLGEWPEGALLLFLFSLGHSLEHMALGKARKAIRALGKLTPKTAHVMRAGQQLEIPVGQLLRGDVVIVRPGERLPIDGKVTKGRTSIDQSPITGESIPVDKEPGAHVFAGTINGDGLIEVEVTRLAKDTTIARVIQMVSEAQTQKGPTQQFTERFTKVFVPAVLVAVLAVWLLPPLLHAYGQGTALARLGLPVRESFLRSMTILVAASPCALAISTPSAILSGIAQGARHGVLFKGGAHLESLGGVKAIAFDKTGTLTRGKPTVTDVVTQEGISERELLRLAASLERRSTHPLAAAVVARARQEDAVLAEPEHVRNEVGRGLSGRVEGRMLRIGSLRLFPDAAIPDSLRHAVRRLEADGRTTMLVEADGTFLGALAVADEPRPESQAIMQQLRAMDIPHLVMLTGDNARVAAAVGARIGLTDVKADLMPEDKVAAVRGMRDRHDAVAMVGDGINDAPAMASSSVSVAMGAGGTDVALETADVALMADSLGKLPYAVSLSRKTKAIIRQNLAVSLGVIAILVPAALFGWTGIGGAIILHEGSTLAVVGNALRLLNHGELS